MRGLPKPPFARRMGKIKPTRRAPIGRALFRARVRLGPKQKNAPGPGEAEFGRARATVDRQEAKHRGQVELARHETSGNAGRSGFRSPKEKAPRANFNATRRFIFAPRRSGMTRRPKNPIDLCNHSHCPQQGGAFVKRLRRQGQIPFADLSAAIAPPPHDRRLQGMARRPAPPAPLRRARARQTGSIQTEWPTARRDALRSHRIVAINHKL